MNCVKPVLVAFSLSLFASQAKAAAPAPKKVLAAKINVKSKLPLATNELKWELVLTNEGDELVRVCTLCGGWGGGGTGSVGHTFAPDFWKSDRPRDEDFDKHIVTLKPGESVSLPSSLGGFRGEQYTLSASYEVGREFAARHKIWQGKAEAKPVVISAVKPRGEVTKDARILVKQLESQVESQRAILRQTEANLEQARALLRALQDDRPDDTIVTQQKARIVGLQEKIEAATRVLRSPDDPLIVRLKQELAAVQNELKNLQSK